MKMHFVLGSLLFLGNSRAFADPIHDASEAVSALEQGLRPEHALEELHDAGRRAEELMLGGGTRVSVSGRSRVKSAPHLLARLVAKLPRKGPIVVKEPKSYRSIGRVAGGLLGFTIGGSLLGGWWMTVYGVPFVNRIFPADSPPILLPVLLVFLITSVPLAILISGAPFGAAGYLLGRSIGGVIDRWKWKK